jgi:hypothetical protein
VLKEMLREDYLATVRCKRQTSAQIERQISSGEKIDIKKARFADPSGSQIQHFRVE